MAIDGLNSFNFGSLAKPTLREAGHQGRNAGSIDANLEKLSYNPFSSSRVATTPSGLEGSLFEGFNVPQNNGTGELIPEISGREDAIEGCSWSPYMA